MSNYTTKERSMADYREAKTIFNFSNERNHMHEPLVIDLFAGLKGWSEPFTEDGHWKVFTTDISTEFPTTLTADILDLTVEDFPAHPTVVLASPPCTAFSVMRIGKNWTKDHNPKTEAAELGMKLVYHTLKLIDDLKPLYWVIENPRAKLRKLWMMENLPRHTVTYCQYGEHRMKPTDLWGGFPRTFSPHSICANGDPCHVAAPRGSRTGTQGMTSAESAKIPYGLARDLKISIEADLYITDQTRRSFTPLEYDWEAELQRKEEHLF